MPWALLKRVWHSMAVKSIIVWLEFKKGCDIVGVKVEAVHIHLQTHSQSEKRKYVIWQNHESWWFTCYLDNMDKKIYIYMCLVLCEQRTSWHWWFICTSTFTLISLWFALIICVLALQRPVRVIRILFWRISHNGAKTTQAACIIALKNPVDFNNQSVWKMISMNVLFFRPSWMI